MDVVKFQFLFNGNFLEQQKELHEIYVTDSRTISRVTNDIERSLLLDIFALICVADEI